ncbi:MAG: LptA/OstA family protein [Candidatus Cloacimonadota bacterium]|nr:LptA/OstA family protein [Candidatus Cloacimonadota bacterium]
MILQKFGKFMFAISLVFFLANNLFSKEHYYTLKNADIVKYDVTKKDTITTLIGNVDIIYDGINFFADNAQLFTHQKMLKMSSNARAVDDTLRAKAEKVVYHHKNKFLHLEKNAVFIVQNSQNEKLKKISADMVDYFKDDGRLAAKGNVSAYDFKENANLICGDFAYDFMEKYGTAKVDPILTFERKNNITIRSRQMEIFTNKNKFTATYDVSINMKNSLAEGNFLIYFKDDEEAVLIGHPNFSSETINATADEFHIFFSDESLKNLHLISNAKLNFKEKTGEKIIVDGKIQNKEKKENYLSAQKVFVELKNEKMSYLHALNVSKSLIRQHKKTESDYFVNKLSTKDLEVFFDHNEKIQQVIAVGDISGVYKFLKK